MFNEAKVRDGLLSMYYHIGEIGKSRVAASEKIHVINYTLDNIEKMINTYNKDELLVTKSILSIIKYMIITIHGYVTIPKEGKEKIITRYTEVNEKYKSLS